MPQGFFVSQNASQFEILHSTGQFSLADIKGYLDSSAMYGDPAANVTFADFGDSAKPCVENVTCKAASRGGAARRSFSCCAHVIKVLIKNIVIFTCILN